MDGATLWIGLAGIVLATISLTWQAVTFRLTGGRVVAHLRVGVQSGGSVISHKADRDWQRRVLDTAAQYPGPPVLVLVASNIGRMGVGVDQVAAVIDGQTRFAVPGDARNPPPGMTLDGLHGATWYVPFGPVQAAIDADAKVLGIRGPRKVWMELELSAGRPVRTREAILVPPLPEQAPVGPAAD
jgi:hypothetical protein